MTFVSATETVRERRDKGSEGVAPPAKGWRGKLLIYVYGRHRSMAQVYRDMIDHGIAGGLRLCIRIEIGMKD